MAVVLGVCKSSLVLDGNGDSSLAYADFKPSDTSQVIFCEPFSMLFKTFHDCHSSYLAPDASGKSECMLVIDLVLGQEQDFSGANSGSAGN